MHPILRHRWVLIAAVAAGTAFLGRHALRLEVDTTNDAMHSTRNPVRAAYDRFHEQFGTDESVLVAVEAPDVLLALDRVDELSRALAALPGVRTVRSLTTEVVPRAIGPLVVPERLAKSTSPDAIVRTLDANPYLRGRLLSRDRTATSLLVVMERRDETELRSVRAAALTHDRDGFRVRVTGLSLTEFDIADAIKRDQLWLVPAIFVAFVLLLAVQLRTVHGVVLPMLVLVLTLAWTMGLYALGGHKLNTVTSLLSPVVMIMSLEVAIHLVKHYEALLAERPDRLRTLTRTLQHLILPCFLTALTTLIGFLSLLFNTIPAVLLFAVYAAAGVMIAFALSIVVVPVGLLLFRVRPRAVVPRAAVLARLASRPGLTVAAAAVLLAAAVAGLPRLRTDTNLLEILRPSAPVVAAARFVDARLTGANAIEVVVERRDGAPLGPADWDGVRRVEALLASRPEVTDTFSIADVLDAIARARGRADAGDLALIRRGAPKDVAAYVTPDSRAARVTGRVRGIGSAGGEALAEWIAHAPVDPALRVQPTGLFALMAYDSNALVRGQIGSLGIAFVLIFLAMAAQFRSLRVGLVCAIPNLVPIAMVFGLMGWAGLRLSTATAMIASVMLGLIVDSTILLVSRWRFEREQLRRPASEALERALAGSGPPILVSALILICGFAIGGFGSFPPTVDFSMLSALTLALGAAASLTLLPALLRFAVKEVSDEVRPEDVRVDRAGSDPRRGCGDGVPHHDAAAAAREAAAR